MVPGLIENVAKADLFEPALAERTISIGRPHERWLYHLIYSTAGSAKLWVAEEALDLSGSAFVLLPPSEPARLTSAAGTRTYLVGISIEMMADALGNYPETTALKVFTENRVKIEDLQNRDGGALEKYFQSFAAERHNESQASLMALNAHLRLILLTAWRLTGAQDPQRAHDGGTVLQKFRLLVETEYRRHRSIAYYAEQLGIKQDRLHDICKRNLERTPMELVHERLTQDARLRLERSGNSVREISDILGFRDPAAFSHFFKRRSGVSPVQYREIFQTGLKGTELIGSTEYHDWP